MTKKFCITGLLAWTVGSLYYLYQYIIRVSPMVMVDDIRADFMLDASTFGTLMAIGTYCYAAMQIPVGVLSDLFGARKMILISLICCIVGVGLFSHTQYLPLAYFGRMLIGVGSAAAFVCVSKISSDWFPPHQKPLWFAGLVILGTVGANMGGNPLAQLVTEIGWRDSLHILTWAGVSVLAINYLFLRDRPVRNGPHRDITNYQDTFNRQELLQQVKSVFFSRHCWLYAFVALGMYLSISVFADLWGVSFIQEKYGVDRGAASSSIAWAYNGVCVGVVITALMSQYIKDSRPIIGVSAFFIAILMAIMTFYEGLNFPMVSIIMFSIGFFAGGEVLCFAQACEHMPVSVAATVTGFINFVVTFGAATIQQVFGLALDSFWSGQIGPDLNRIYALSDYQGALTIVLLIACSSIILSFYLPKDVIEEE